jgi:hypothetical protein
MRVKGFLSKGKEREARSEEQEVRSQKNVSLFPLGEAIAD